MNVDIESDIHNSCSTVIREKVEALINELLIKVEADVVQNLNDDECGMFSFTNTCDSCATQDSLFWRRVARSKIVCNRCFFTQTYLLQFKENKPKKTSPEINNDEQEPVRYVKKTRASFKGIQSLVQSQQIFSSLTETDLKDSNAISNVKTLHKELQMFIDDPMITRKSARFTREKSKKNDMNGKDKGGKAKKSRNSKSEDTQSDKASPVTSPNSQAVIRALESKLSSSNGQKSRRTKIFKSEKSPPIRSQFLTSTIFTSEFVFHRGFFMQVGDIVALFDLADSDSNTPYFAQIRAFMTDQYGAKSAVLTWLIPIDSNYSKKIYSPKDFDPDMFVLGPAEDFPRPLDCLEFVCRLIDSSSKSKRSDYFNNSCQFNSDLQRHKFLLNDLAESKLKLITKKSVSEHKPVEHEIKWG